MTSIKIDIVDALCDRGTVWIESASETQRQTYLVIWSILHAYITSRTPPVELSVSIALRRSTHE